MLLSAHVINPECSVGCLLAREQTQKAPAFSVSGLYASFRQN